MDVSTLINNFMKQKIQSEAEVRSKLIVPLLELLGYSQDYRAEEFPVYGYEGSKALPTKAADFIQFSSNEFSENRGKSKENLRWVHSHSLLVVEAKKPSEEVLVVQQPIFYSCWTKSIAYIITNGVDIEGYIVNANYNDARVFSCKVQEIPENWDVINKINYINIVNMKDTADYTLQWDNSSAYEEYYNAMRVRCCEELSCCIDRNLETASFDMKLTKNGEKKSCHEIADNTNKIITSEPGGGKTHLMWMLMRDYLSLYSDNEEKIPVILQGRYFGKGYNSIEEGIYKEFSPILPFVTKELVENNLRQGKYIILFDALDEVDNNYESLIYSINHIQKYTDNTLVVTARIQNYKGDFSDSFMHYILEPLNDNEIMVLLSAFSKGEYGIHVSQIPRKLRDVIRTPLFLRMFVDISKKDNAYRIPTNYVALFQEYLESKLRKYSLLDKSIIETILENYAVNSFDDCDSTNEFVKIVKSEGGDNDIYEKLWKTGILINAQDGVRFFHKSMQEYCYACSLARCHQEELSTWLERNVNNERYSEIICYLTGIISIKMNQNNVLDYLETQNLKLYIKALESRKSFNPEAVELDLNYAQKYFEQLLKTYTNIIESFFTNIKREFDGYRYNDNSCCINGSLNYDNKSLHIVIYSRIQHVNSVNVALSDTRGVQLISPDGKSIPITSSVHATGMFNVRYYNLELMSYGLDSSREIAVDIIKNQLKEMVKNQYAFDPFINVLLVERTEKELKTLRRKNAMNNTLSLYDRSIRELIIDLLPLREGSSAVDRIIVLCNLLSEKSIDINSYLDIRPDLNINETSLCTVDSAYSDAQLFKKVNRIQLLSDEAVNYISETLIPVLSTASNRTRKIGVVYRNDNDAGVCYVNVRNRACKDNSPILNFFKDRKEAFPKLDKYYIEQLKQINSCEEDIVSSTSTVIFSYFGDNVFHDIIYKEIKRLIEVIFGRL